MATGRTRRALLRQRERAAAFRAREAATHTPAAVAPVSADHDLSELPVHAAAAASDESGYEADNEAEARHPRLTPAERAELRKVPRHVTRTDATIDSQLGSYGASAGKPKAYRTLEGTLMPAGSGMHEGQPVTTTQHLLGRYPEKGASSHISFTNAKRAGELRDYSQAEKPVAAAAPDPVAAAAPAPVATLSARKLAKARLRGKRDVDHTDLMTTPQIRSAVAADGAAAKTQRTVLGYVARDAEVHSVGQVPGRFLRFSDRAAAAASDSDSDSVSDVSTEYSDEE